MVNIPRIKTTKNSVWYSTRKNRRACGVSLWSEHKTKSLLGWRQLRRSRNSNREVWESPSATVGVDVKDRININSKQRSAGSRKWLAAHFFGKSQAMDNGLLLSSVSCSELRGKQPSCWISLATSTVGGGDTS